MKGSVYCCTNAKILLFFRISPWCGSNGTVSNSAAFGDAVSALEIATVWKFATEGLVSGHAPGGPSTCVAAVAVALGECGHVAQSNWETIHDKVRKKHE